MGKNIYDVIITLSNFIFTGTIYEIIVKALILIIIMIVIGYIIIKFYKKKPIKCIGDNSNNNIQSIGDNSNNNTQIGRDYRKKNSRYKRG